MPLNNFLFGSNGYTEQLPTLSKGQISNVEGLGKFGMNQLQNPYQGFQPIEENARKGFASRSIPLISERFGEMLQGNNRLGSSGFADILGGASKDLETELASMRAQYGQQSNRNALDALRLGLSPTFENIKYEPTQGFLQTAGTALAGGFGSALGSGLTGGLGSLGSLGNLFGGNKQQGPAQQNQSYLGGSYGMGGQESSDMNAMRMAEAQNYTNQARGNPGFLAQQSLRNYGGNGQPQNYSNGFGQQDFNRLQTNTRMNQPMNIDYNNLNLQNANTYAPPSWLRGFGNAANYGTNALGNYLGNVGTIRK